jgi:hypothetical protein
MGYHVRFLGVAIQGVTGCMLATNIAENRTELVASCIRCWLLLCRVITLSAWCVPLSRKSLPSCLASIISHLISQNISQ